MRKTLADAFRGPGAAARVAGAALLLGTVAIQHPNTAFNRLEARDRFSVLPNWRFFAPNPATYDYHFFYRTQDTAGTTSEWRTVDVIEGRRFRQILWFPTRRPEKAIFDICSELLGPMNVGVSAMTETTGYAVLIAHLRERIRAENPPGGIRGFQFGLARAAGFAETEPEMIFVSPFTPMDPGPTPPRVRRKAAAARA
ncbi:hypothetical protein K4749_29640 [Streptomyces sp. TRM72054]|uniref:hypothetical protein n=1 Tax=Streptomyces sp. TRM72054 TaxID=2870562 RepID=UPI001C8C6BAD|nr:hypothetical protein [Streptomyces sp. TRM72054]MBX9397639.1 hypothetical protein [Streptomyces sp. TRM72054]